MPLITNGKRRYYTNANPEVGNSHVIFIFCATAVVCLCTFTQPGGIINIRCLFCYSLSLCRSDCLDYPSGTDEVIQQTAAVGLAISLYLSNKPIPRRESIVCSH